MLQVNYKKQIIESQSHIRGKEIIFERFAAKK
jgi:hypothetical protein